MPGKILQRYVVPVSSVRLHSLLLLLPLAFALAGCVTTDTGPTPLPSVVCNLSCGAETSLDYGAVLELRLVAFPRPDVRPSVLAERIESNPGRLPLRFRLFYNAGAIDPGHDYAVEARILFKGRPLWVQREPLPVLTKGHPSEVDVVLQLAP